MHVINWGKLRNVRMEPHERYFLELWFSMTHPHSLDSYRVKCMNSRMMVRELSEELHIGRILQKDYRGELIAICAEASAALTKDALVVKHFPNHLALVQPLLDKFKAPENDAKKDETEDHRRFRFVVDDLLSKLEATYFTKLCAGVVEELTPNNEDRIRSMLSSLLADLVDQGWDLGTLFRWHRNFLLGQRSFRNNLDFMFRQLQRPPQRFDVILRLSGSSRLGEIGEFCGFTISGTTSISTETDKEKRFAVENPMTHFATRRVDSVDFYPAAMIAREILEEQLSLVRFDYERDIVKVEDGCHVTRVNDSRPMLLRVEWGVPNPLENVDHEDFMAFLSKVDLVCKKSTIDESSREQLKAAIRQYRFGRDSTNYRDMFLNWWLGLEALAHVGRGKGIGATVTHNVSRVIALPHFSRMLEDLLATLRYCRIAWPQQLIAGSGIASLDELTAEGLLGILQADSQRSLLLGQCSAYPTLAYRGAWIAEWLSEPQKAVTRFRAHQQNVEWQMQRIYRIRCCIVHGSEVRYRLPLITANLEYYLKQTILFALHSFHENDHIRNLDELYARASITCDAVISALDTPGALPDKVRDAVYADVVTREQR